MESMGIALVWCMLQVTLLVVLAGIVYLVVRRYVPAAGALVTAATIGAVVVVSALAFSPWPRWQLATVEQAVPDVIEENEPVAPANHEPASSTPIETPIAEAEPVAAEIDWALMLQALGEQLRVEPIIEAKQPRRWPTYLAIGLILITCVGITRLLLGLSSMRKFRRLSRAVDDSNINELVDVLRAELGYAHSIELRELDCVTTAATIGWRRPVILLPSEWTDWNAAQRRAVLAHEIAHVRSGDYLVHLLAQISLVFHFYHPLVHWLVARLRLEQELAADALAARLAGGQTAYLKTLAEMALRQSDESLGWPARTFLPTRGTFLRRIEMLRDSKSLLTTAPKSARWLSAGSILMIGLLAVGIRGPGVEQVVAALPESKPQEKETKAVDESEKRFSLDYVPADAIAVIALRPAEILKQPGSALLTKEIDELFKSMSRFRNIGLPLSGIEEVTFVVIDPKEQPRMIIRTINEIEERLSPLVSGQKKQFAGKTLHLPNKNSHFACLFAGANTAVIDTVAQLRIAAVAAAGEQLKPDWTQAWSKSSQGQLNCLINMAKVRVLLKDQPPLPPMMRAFSPIWEESHIASISGSFLGNVQLQATLYGQTPKNSDGTTAKIQAAFAQQSSEEIVTALRAVVTLAKVSLGPLRKQSAKEPAKRAEALLSFIQMGDKLLGSSEIAGNKNGTVTLTMGKDNAVKIDAGLLESLVGALVVGHESAQRIQSKNNLRQIALASYGYHDKYGFYPPHVMYGPDGKTPYSWRVALLPGLEQQELYDQYRFDEPWDSKHNKQLIAKIPPAFQNPSDDRPPGNACVFAIVGKDTMFPGGGKKMKFENIPDGTSNTIMFVEARRDIPWTKPEDIPYDADKPLPKFGGFYKGIFTASKGDASVHQVSQDVAEDILRPYITISDGIQVQPLR